MLHTSTLFCGKGICWQLAIDLKSWITSLIEDSYALGSKSAHALDMQMEFGGSGLSTS
jgi:hypothetical protein